jgi:cyclohexanone monooxygenase
MPDCLTDAGGTFPPSPQTAGSTFPGRTAPLEAIIVGAGFGGVGMAIALKRQGVQQFVVLEKRDDVGGVWRDNTYPGAACDVPSHLYSFSFEPNPDWSRSFAGQAEIHDYLRRCAAKFGIVPHIRFGAEVARADYDESVALWIVTLADGAVLRARMLISAVGQLSRPALPRLAGMDRLKIPAFHSARWDHKASLEGKRVAVIGTGASAIQFVPAIAERVASLKVFQRSAGYIIPRADRAYTEGEKARFRRMPWLMKLHRLGIYLRYESRALAFTRFKSLMKVAVGMQFKRQLKSQVQDPALRAKLVPNYPIGCKRMLLSSEYLATMSRPNLQLVTNGIRTLTENGVETVDGERHEVDVVIYGTGFAATEFLSPMRITGRDGLDLNVAWQHGASAYLGLAVPGFPNFFMLYGPNTNLGHNSIVYMLESQIAHVMRCRAEMRAAGAASVEVRDDIHEQQDAHVQQRLAGTVWAGCKSWYIDEAGRNTTNWPGFTFTYRWQTRHSSLNAYRFAPAPGGGHIGVSAETLVNA